MCALFRVGSLVDNIHRGLLFVSIQIGSIKDRNGMDLTQAKDIKKRWQEYKEELYKKDLHYSDDHDGVIIAQSQTSWTSRLFSSRHPDIQAF